MTLLKQHFNEAQRSILAAYWRKRAEGEYTSWVAFQQIRADLCLLDAHPATIALASEAVEDERRHAEWCLDYATHFGQERQKLVARTEEPLRFCGAPEALQPLLRVAFCCMTETLGCFVLKAQRPHIFDPQLRHLNQRHLADEIQHSRVGWSFLASMDERQKDQLRPWLPALLGLLTQVAEAGAEEQHDELLSGGYFTKSLLVQSGKDALSFVIVPGLVAHQLLEAA